MSDDIDRTDEYLELESEDERREAAAGNGWTDHIPLPPEPDEPPDPEPPDDGRADDDNHDDEAGWTFIDGATFILDQPATIPTLWGHGNNVLWPEDESLMIAGPMGLGKTTLAIQLMHAQLGLGDGIVLGLPVAPCPGIILYLAMDRPAQIARAARRLFTEAQRQVLAERVLIWRGPPPGDIAKNPGLLNALAEKADAHTVYLDSIKDAALGLSEDEVGAGYNRARQHLLAHGRQLAEQHHTTKRGAGGRAPTSVADIYGSAWIANGTGSIILLSGEPGDPIVGFRHVRAPADEVGPWRLLHNQRAGLLTIEHHVSVFALAEAADGKLTAKQAAAGIYETDKPSRAQIQKATRRLNDLVPAVFTRVDGTKGGGKNARPSVWLLPGVDPAPFTDPSLFDDEGGPDG
jgi:hypothetical protein